MDTFELDKCPVDVLGDVNRHAPFECECGAVFQVDLKIEANPVLAEPTMSAETALG